MERINLAISQYQQRVRMSAFIFAFENLIETAIRSTFWGGNLPDEIDHEVLIAGSQENEIIGKFDRQVWEQSVEQEVLKKLRSVPRKTAKVNPDLIDVDLFGGSAFCRPKPRYGWLAVSRRAILRVIFFPLYQRWWRSSTSGWMFTLLCLLYVLQVSSLIICLTDPGQSLSAEMLSVAHLASPCIIMFVLALVHSQIMAIYESSSAHYTQMQAKNKKSKARNSKRKMKTSGCSERESTGSHDTGIYLNPDDIDGGMHPRLFANAIPVYDGSVEMNDKIVPENIPSSSDRLSSSMFHRRTSFEKTSAWLQLQQQQSTKQDLIVSNGLSDMCFEQAAKSSTTLTSGSDKPRCLVANSRSEPSLAALPTKSSDEVLEVSKSSVQLVRSQISDEAPCSRSSMKSDALSDANNGIVQKSRQLRFCCVMPNRHNDRRQSAPVVGSDDLSINPPVGDEVSHQLGLSFSATPEEQSEERCFEGNLCCASASSLNETEDPSAQDDGLSVANSNTSISDTCNSSLKSSTEDLASEVNRSRKRAVDGESPVGFSRTCCVTHNHGHHNHQSHRHHHHQRCHIHSYGVRQRKRSSQDCSGRSHLNAVFDLKRISPETLMPEVNSKEVVGGLELEHSDSKGFRRSSNNNGTNVSSPNDSPSVPASTDEDASPLLRVSPSKGRQGHHARQSRKASGLMRCSRLGELCTCCNGSIVDPAMVERKEAGSWRCNGGINMINDVRLLESTGISSGDSDGEAAKKKAKASAASKKFRRGMLTQDMIDQRTSTDIATSEWEDTVNTEMTSGSISESSSQRSSSQSDISEKDILGNGTENPSGQSIQHVSSVMNNLASNTDRVSCMIWEPNAVHKVDLTVLDIGWTIIQKVDKMPETCDYLVLGIAFSIVMMFMPTIYRIYHSRDQIESINYHELAEIYTATKLAFGHNWRQIAVILNGMLQRLWLGLITFFLLSVGERTFKQRLLYAKNFCYLTSSRRAKKYELPHFRLNKVRNIKTWLSLRSFLKKRGPQRSVEIIVSAAFLLAIILVSIVCIELLQDYGTFLDHLGNWELVMWCMCLGVYLLRFITLGTKINKKYRNFSVLITEQINLYLHMEQKPHKKEELMVANSVLRLAEDLLKELESPFKISGLSANPFLYNITKVVVLSAFSAVLTELLGFKLKLYKIKIRA